jgi:ribosomal protein L35AE/L33A
MSEFQTKETKGREMSRRRESRKEHTIKHLCKKADESCDRHVAKKYIAKHISIKEREKY